MKYTFHIVDIFSWTPFGGNQLAVLPDASSISTDGMQKIAREFNFGEMTFVLPKKDPANTCRLTSLSETGVPRHVDIIGEDRGTDRRTFSDRTRRRPIR